MFTSQTSAKGANPARVFSSDLIKELNIAEVTFNAFATTYVSKHFERLAKAEGLDFVDKNFLDYLTSTCNGDLRSAFNILCLQNPSQKENTNVVVPVKRGAAPKKDPKKAAPSKDKVLFENNNKDLTLNIFRSLGKVLYRKNMETSSDEKCLERFRAERKLPVHLKHLQTAPMTCEPEEIYSKIPISDENFTMYLHQNYIEIFQLKFFDQTFEKKFNSLEQISDAFILADQLNSRLNFSDASNSVSETKVKEISTVATMRSILFNFSKDAETEGTIESKTKSAWMPLYKPFTHKVIEQNKKRIQQAEDLLGKGQSAVATNSIYLSDINKEFFTTHLPFLNLIFSKKRAYLKDFKITDDLLLFSKYKAVNSKTSVETDQATFKEKTASQQDGNAFESTEQQEEGGNSKKRPSSQVLTQTNDKVFKDEGIYESFEALSCIDEIF